MGIPLGLTALKAIGEPASLDSKKVQASLNSSTFSIVKHNPVIYIIFGLIFFSSFQLYAVVIYVPQLLELFGVSSSLEISTYITSMAYCCRHYITPVRKDKSQILLCSDFSCRSPYLGSCIFHYLRGRVKTYNHSISIFYRGKPGTNNADSNDLDRRSHS